MSLSRTIRPFFSELSTIERDFARAFAPSLYGQNLMSGFPTASPLAQAFAQRQPLFHVRESDKDIVVEAETPGFKKENLAVELDGSRLIIRGLQEQRKAAEGGAQGAQAGEGEQFYDRREFQQSLELPPELTGAPITAHYEDGVLRVKLTKPEPVKKSPVQISIAGPNTAPESMKVIGEGAKPAAAETAGTQTKAHTSTV
eukprot:comp23994_c0_seq2/m.42674 comp23994_c0_seq2/g.42674  ORF comp23994_c0_seq2/g.42674 comp23994_c0_seq2/m.42674 type:complete len:200 (-) comp23994_c0_seq2:169-768(-)